MTVYFTIPFKSVGSLQVLFKEINTFNTNTNFYNDSKDIYVTKDLYFKHMLFFCSFYSSNILEKKMHHSFHKSIKQ